MSLFNGDSPALPPASTIIVTGANGYIGAHVCSQLLSLGYTVRGTVRSLSRSQWVLAAFEPRYPGRFSLVEIDDLGAPGALDQVLQGASGLAHIATEAASGSDPNISIPATIRSTLNVFHATVASPTVTRFVLTSSSATLYTPSPASKKPRIITSSDWSIEAVSRAYAPPPYGRERFPDVYAASKALSEAALWKAYRELDLDIGKDFVANTVAPDSNFGPFIDPAHKSSTGQLLDRAWEQGDGSLLAFFARAGYRWMVDVRDTARLHVGALLDPSVRGEKLLGYAHKYTGDELVEVMRRLDRERGVQREVKRAVEGDWWCIDEVDTRRSEEVLRRIGSVGWTEKETTLRDALLV